MVGVKPSISPSRKGQVNIIGFMVVTLIILIAVSISFVWGRGIIEKSANVNELNRIEIQMVNLHSAIKDVANEHSQRTVPFDIKDGWLLIPDNQTVRFESFGDIPSSVSYNPNRILLGNYSSSGPCFNSSTLVGRLGYDEPGCLIQKAGVFELNYILLNDTVANECFAIALTAGKNVGATKGSHNILLTYNNTWSGTHSNCSSVKYSSVIVSVE